MQRGAMDKEKTYRDDRLTITRQRTSEGLTLHFYGRSIVRDPADFLMPLLSKYLDATARHNVRLILDFRRLSYMNSSTFTPLIKILQKARLGDHQVTAIYSKVEKWQEVSFGALTIFGTEDGRIDIRAED